MKGFAKFLEETRKSPLSLQDMVLYDMSQVECDQEKKLENFFIRNDSSFRLSRQNFSIRSCSKALVEMQEKIDSHRMGE